jgi:hypothetical protein
MPTYRGGCHCGRTRFEVEGTIERVTDCNCSICASSGFLHWRIEPEQLRMHTPWENLSVYVWGTGRARHYFCPTCGVAPLRNPRNDPASRGITRARATARPSRRRHTIARPRPRRAR